MNATTRPKLTETAAWSNYLSAVDHDGLHARHCAACVSLAGCDLRPAFDAEVQRTLSQWLAFGR